MLGIRGEPLAKLFDGSMSSIRASCLRCSRSAGVAGNSFADVFGENFFRVGSRGRGAISYLLKRHWVTPIGFLCRVGAGAIDQYFIPCG